MEAMQQGVAVDSDPAKTDTKGSGGLTTGSGNRSGGGGGGGGGTGGGTRDEPAWGALIVLAGLIALVLVFIPALLHYKQASEVATATAGVSGVIAALVGAYFGVRGATLAQKQTSSSEDSS
jgi:hypothetical protein